MEERNMPRADFVTSIFFIAFGVLVLVMSINMPRLQEFGVNPYSVPGIVPGFLGGVIAFLGLVLLIRSVLRQGYRMEITGASVRKFLKARETKRLLTTILVSVAYGLVLLGRIPYPLATGLYILAFVLIFEYRWDRPLRSQVRTILVAFGLAAVISAAVTGVFRYVFLVNLPG